MADPSTGDSAYRRRHGKDFKGNLIPFGANIQFLPSPTSDCKESAKGQVKFGPSGKYGVFLGYKVLSGGNGGAKYMPRPLRT